MDDKQLFEAWRLANTSTTGGIDYLDMTRTIIGGERKTALQRLAERYKRFYCMSFIVAALWIVFSLNPVFGAIPTWIILTVGTTYFLLAGALDTMLYNKICDIDVLSMSVKEVIHRARAARRFHLRCMIALIPFALVVLGLLVWSGSGNEGFMYGAAAGFMVGVAIGVYQLNKFMRDYRLIMRDDEED